MHTAPASIWRHDLACADSSYRADIILILPPSLPVIRWAQEILNPERNCVTRIMRLVMVFTWLSYMMKKVVTMQSPVHDSLPGPYEQHQSGDFLIGGIVSQFSPYLHSFCFQKWPPEELLKVPE